MNSYRPARSTNPWLTAAKILILILGIYVSALILSKLFTWIFVILFALIKAVAFIVAGILILHFFLKLLFGYDFLQVILGPRFRRR